jgi:prepilin-type N-terminal cleavage/methylation domain-containing protein
MRRLTSQPRPRRRGFTLAELLVVVTILGFIGTALSLLLMRQGRFHRAVISMTDARARMRDIATILPTDLRGVSTAASDILSYSVNSLQFRAFVGTSIVCRYGSATIIDLPPTEMASKTLLTAWINPPVVGDLAYIYNDGIDTGNADDSWVRYTITTVTSAANPTWCPSTNTPKYTDAADDGQVRYRITLSAAPDQAQTKVGSVIRFAREVRYAGYQASDGKWYVGYQTCTPAVGPTTAGVCGAQETLAGPIQPVTTDTTTSGLFFVFYNQSGTRVTADADKATIARVNVGIRTLSESLRRASATQLSTFAGGDSLRFTIGIRNRI